MKRKLLMTMVMAGMMAATMPSISYAATSMPLQPIEVVAEDTVQPRYVNTANISANLKISGSTAYATASVTAKKVCNISVVMRLQRKSGSSWNTVSSWVESTNGATKSMTKSFALSTRGTYRVYAIFNVAGEELTYTSVSKTY